LRGSITKGFGKGEKDIWIDQISGIQWREPGDLMLGHIQFTLIGGSTDSVTMPESSPSVVVGDGGDSGGWVVSGGSVSAVGEAVTAAGAISSPVAW
jgi:hypothetical protein